VLSYLVVACGCGDRWSSANKVTIRLVAQDSHKSWHSTSPLHLCYTAFYRSSILQPFDIAHDVSPNYLNRLVLQQAKFSLLLLWCLWSLLSCPDRLVHNLCRDRNNVVLRNSRRCWEAIRSYDMGKITHDGMGEGSCCHHGW